MTEVNNDNDKIYMIDNDFMIKKESIVLYYF